MFAASKSGKAGSPTDSNFKNVSLLLETSASLTKSTTATDSSASPLTVTKTGSPSSGWISPYQTDGYWSNYFNGSSYLTISANTAFALSGDFTIEMWVYPTAAIGAYRALIATGGSGSTDQFGIGTDPSVLGMGCAGVLSGNSVVPAVGVWTHVAVSRTGTSVYFFLNGVQQGTTKTSSSAALSGSATVSIAYRAASGDSVYTGYISNLRVVKGTGLYTAGFTPSTTPLSAITNTSLLTCRSNRFQDNGTANAGVGFPITVAGTPQVTGYYYPGTFTAPNASIGAGYFNGSTDYLQVPAGTAFAPGTGDFTVECWVYVVTHNVAQGNYIWTQSVSGTNYFLFAFNSTTANFIAVTSGGGTPGINGPTTTINTNVWHHIAVTRFGGIVRVFVNGVSGTATSNTIDLTNVSYTPTIGSYTHSVYGLWAGYISNLRYVKGTAVYTGNFTPPTSFLQTSGSASAACYPSTTNVNTSFVAANTSLLVNFSESNYTSATSGVQNNTFIDTGPYAWTITRVGTATQGSFTPYWPTGYWGNYLDGSSSMNFALNSYLTTGPCTIEAWVNCSSFSNSPFIIENANWNIGQNCGWRFGIGTNGKIGFNASTGTFNTFPSVLTTTSAVTINTWNHIAFVRDASNVCRIYINGVDGGGSVTYSASFNLNSGVAYRGTEIGRIIADGGAYQYLTGYISNLRVVNNTAVYTAPFTPSTAPLTAISGTSLLTCQSNRFVDNSVNNATFTLAGTPRVQALQPFNPPVAYTAAAYGGSGYFNGTTDYLTAASSTVFAFGSSVDFTVECWAYPLAYGATIYGASIIGTTNGAATGWSLNLGQGIDNFRLISNATGTWADNILAGAGNGLPLNAWTHVALVRNGSTITLYKNGTSVGTPVSAGSTYNFTAPNNLAYVGLINDGSNGNRFFNGYISNLRVVKGTAVYTGNFTLPTAPVTAITNTSLLVNFTNAGIYDAAVQNDATTVDNTQASTTQFKWTPTSMRFDGAGDSLTMPANPIFAWGTGDFTIELWANNSAAFVSSRNNLAGTMTSGGGLFAPTNTNMNWNSFGVGDIVTAAYVPTIGQWYHLAYSRSSGTGRLFINGIFVASASDSTNYTSTSFTAGGITSQYFNGYIQDLRVTRGVGRYTTVFSVPTAALTPTATTVLLLNTTSTNAQTNNTFLDSSANNFNITRNGTPTQGSITPYWPDGYWSNYVSNTSYLSLTLAASNIIFPSVNSGGITIEFWVNVSATSSTFYSAVVTAVSYSIGEAWWELGCTNTGITLTFGSYGYSSANMTSSTPFVPGQWTHVVVQRRSNGTNWDFFQNGVNTAPNIAGVGYNSNFYNPTSPIRFGIGQSGNTGCYVSNFRIINNSAFYPTTGFTPPTAPLTIVTGTVLLTCQSNRFKDNSTNNFTFTVSSTPLTQTFQPFNPPASYTAAAYGGSGYFNGTTDYLTFSTSTPALALSNSDFTVEAWVYRTSGTGNAVILTGQNDLATAGGSSYVFYTSSSATSDLYIGASGYGITSPNVPLNTWSHVVWARTGGTYSSYLNGTRVGTRADLSTGSVNTGATTYAPSVGGFANVSNFFPGYISNLRLIKGSGGYNATSSTITITIAPVTAITNTSLLLNFTNTAIYDAAVQNNAITVGSAQASTTVYKWSPTSIKFNGTTDYLTMPLGANLQFSTGTFTVECWSYLISRAVTQPAIFSNYNSYTTGALSLFAGHGSGTTTAYQVAINGATFPVIQGGTIAYNTWVHLAVVRANGVISLYVNGTVVGTPYSTAVTLNGVGSLFYVGNTGDNIANGYINGYLQDFRVTKEVAPAFTPPITAFPTR